MAARKRNIDYVTGAELARRLKLTRSSITQARQYGRIEYEPGKGELYDFEKCKARLRGERRRPEITERLTGTAWAAKHRVLADGSPSGRKWSPKLTPYVCELLDRMTDPKEKCRVFVNEKGSQLGATTIAENLIGFHIYYDPLPMIMTQETSTKMKSTARNAIQPMLNVPLFEDLVSPPGARSGPVNSLSEIAYPGGSISMSGSNSAASYSSKSAPIIILDEYARYPADVKKEGDVLTLALGRIRTYGNKARIYVPSTPVDDIEQTGSMTALHQMGDCREFFVPCPHCMDMDFLRPERFEYALQPKVKAWMICEACGAAGTKRQYARLFGEGEWRATKKPALSFLTSYRMPAFLAPLKWGVWEDIAEQWDQAKQGTLSMQGVQNLQFGRPYTPEVITVGEKMLTNHMADFKEGTVPKGAAVVTVAFDVQERYLAWEAKAWGPGLKSWSFAADEIPGTLNDDAVREQVRALVLKQWPTESGGQVQAAIAMIDSGYATAEVYSLCNEFQQPVVLTNHISVPKTGCLIPTKGFNAYDPDRLVVNARPAKLGQTRYASRVWSLGGPIAKMALFQNLARNPEDTSIGQVVYPKSRPMSWMRQLLAEKPTRATNTIGRKIVKWVKKEREPNESLDLHVMHAAGASILDLGSWTAEKWRSSEQAMKPVDKTKVRNKRLVRPKEKGAASKQGRKSKMVRPKDKR